MNFATVIEAWLTRSLSDSVNDKHRRESSLEQADEVDIGSFSRSSFQRIRTQFSILRSASQPFLDKIAATPLAKAHKLFRLVLPLLRTISRLADNMKNLKQEHPSEMKLR
jgi:hypothetical protein